MSGRRPTPVEAVSGIGHDLNMTGVRFLGVPPRSQTLAGVYSLNYGVQCEQCSFSTRRPASWIPWEDVELLFGEFEVTTHTGVTGTARWPQLNCPTAGESDLASCADACGEQPVAVCRMTYFEERQACEPIARCVEVGETL